MSKFFLSFIILVLFNNCTEVVPIELNTNNRKLVIEANINWEKETDGQVQTIKLTTTTDFYTNIIPVVSDAIVQVTNIDTNEKFNFLEEDKTGIYKCTSFVPITNNNYRLEIIAQGKTYTSTEKLMAVSPISEITQVNNSGINGRSIRIQAFFLDPRNISNFYLFNYNYRKEDESFTKPVFYVSKDSFYDGNPFFSGTFRDSIKSGDVIKITHFGISQNYFNYLTILLRLANQNGGPFSAPPVAVRGNIVNINDENDSPFGYFSLSESDFKDYTVK